MAIRQSQKCVDSLGHSAGSPPGLYPCHGTGGNQEWIFTKDGQLKHLNEICISVHGSQVILEDCRTMRDSQVRTKSPGDFMGSPPV